MNRLRIAELTSGVGALVLGVGLGALFATRIGRSAGVVVVLGVSLHAVGMWDKHRLDLQRGTPTPVWVVGFYWLCWLLLAAVLGALFFDGVG